jgi:TRAP-type C4-dicarboxylate transport system permease small subunit
MWMITHSDRVAKLLMIQAAVWAVILCFVIVADVIGRGMFNSPLQGTPEIVANSIVMIVFLQSGYAIRSRSMLRADFLIDLFHPAIRRLVLALGYLLGILFFVILISGAIDPAIHSWTSGEYEGEGALRVPSWPTRFIILIGAALGVINYLVLAFLDVFSPADASGGDL